MVEVWIGVGTGTTWLGLGKDHGLGQNKYIVKVREIVRFELKITTLLRLGDLGRHGYSNNHLVKVRERHGHG